MSARTPPRMRLPSGFISVRADIGNVLRDARRGEAGREIGHKQDVLAEAVGISRITLSRIERGHAVPRMDTLNRLMHALELETPDVLDEGQEAWTPLRAADTVRTDKEANLGAAIRDARRGLRLSIARVAEAAGVSAAQLSRIERGQSLHSKWFGWHADDKHLDEDDRRRVLLSPVLAGLLRGRWAERL